MNSYADLYAEIDSMELHDCLVWKVPNGISAVSLVASISHKYSNYKYGILVRTLKFEDKVFIVRVA